ncbi:MAG: amidase family protein, partial [Burkholderiaceae bacterium]
MSVDLTQCSAVQLLAMYRSAQVSPVEVTQAVLARINQTQPVLNAFCLVDEEAALASARQSETRWQQWRQSGAPVRALEGVPASIKDLILTRGWPTRRGSHTVNPDQAWEVDAPVTARLREAGAVLLGKTTTPEFGCKGETNSPLTGITRNPWNLDTTPGGSSAGAAAIVAAGISPFAVGTDGGGSVRIPGSLAGLFAIKAHFGRVPIYPVSATHTLAHVGPMSRGVRDAALALGVMAGFDARDHTSALGPVPDFSAACERAPKGLRVIYSRTLGYARP